MDLWRKEKEEQEQHDIRVFHEFCELRFENDTLETTAAQPQRTTAIHAHRSTVTMAQSFPAHAQKQHGWRRGSVHRSSPSVQSPPTHSFVRCVRDRHFYVCRTSAGTRSAIVTNPGALYYRYLYALSNLVISRIVESIL